MGGVGIKELPPVNDRDTVLSDCPTEPLSEQSHEK